MNDIYVMIGGRKYLPLNMRMDTDGNIMIRTNRSVCIPDNLDETVQNTKPRSNCGISIKNVIFNPPATIVLWSDGTKSVVKAQNGEKFDPEKGMAMAILKRIAGNKGIYYNDFAKWCKNYKTDGEKSEEPVMNDSAFIVDEKIIEKEDVTKEDLNSLVLPEKGYEKNLKSE